MMEMSITIKCIELNLNIKRNIEELETFFLRFDLQLEKLDRMYIAVYGNNEWLGCGGRHKNILKCFAVNENRRNEALLDILVTELIKDSYKQGFEDLFIYTKSNYVDLFRNFGFNLVADTNAVCLLHRGPRDIQNVLDDIRVDIKPDTLVGAVVLNANPFTYGHRHLIESASSRVDRLLIFVVENDAPRFPFKDRFMLVKEQTKDLENVSVLPSTEFIISNATFPSYFLKENKLVDSEHAKLDSMIFKKYFVLHFNIKKRFLGEEPIDQSTSIYNETLLSVLPPECEVIVIERKKLGDQYISASTVRREFDKGNFELIKDLVPEGTYRYLKENYR